MNLEDLVHQIEKEFKEKVNLLVCLKDEFSQRILKKYLSQKGIEVLNGYVDQADELFKKIKKEGIQVVILENNLEEIKAIAEKIKNFNPETKILYFLELKFLEYLYLKKVRLSDFFSAGIDDIAFKPLSLEELQARLYRLLRDYYHYKKIVILSKEDPLTGVYNRRYFEEKIREEAYRAMRQKYPLTLLMLDLNKFKWYNDHFGHRAGDEVLKKVAKRLKSSVRDKVDAVCRYGGDEFVILLPNTTWEGAVQVIKRIFNAWNELKIEPVTVAVGVAQLIPRASLEETVIDLIHRADRAMYIAKREEINAYHIDDVSLKGEEESKEETKKEEILSPQEIELLFEGLSE